MLRSLAIAICLHGNVSGAGASPRPDDLISIRIHPARIVLDGRESRQRIVVDGIRSDGRIIDLTDRAHLALDHSGASRPAAWLDPGGVVRPARDGAATLLAG